MIVKGQCKVCSEKLNVRTKQTSEYAKYQVQPKPITLKGNFKDQFIREEQQNRERIKIFAGSLKEKMTYEQYQRLMQANNRMLFMEKLFRDEKGQKIDGHLVYKDLMVFFKLLERDFFGGRVMLTKTHSNNTDSSANLKQPKYTEEDVEQLENPVEGESFEVSYGSFSDSDDGDLMKPSMKKLQRKPTINVA